MLANKSLEAIMLANKSINIWRKLTWLGMLASLALILAACGTQAPAPTQDINGQVATIVALTQAAPPVAMTATPAPSQPTPTSAPLPVILQLAPDLQTILSLPESKLTIRWSKTVWRWRGWRYSEARSKLSLS